MQEVLFLCWLSTIDKKICIKKDIYSINPQWVDALYAKLGPCIHFCRASRCASRLIKKLQFLKRQRTKFCLTYNFLFMSACTILIILYFKLLYRISSLQQYVHPELSVQDILSGVLNWRTPFF